MIYQPDKTPAPVVSHHPNDHLVDAIVRAWTDTDFRDRLLTFKDPNKAEWTSGNLAQKAAMILKTADALAEVGVRLDTPVVLTETQYANHYLKQDTNEIVFVLPNPSRTSAGRSQSAARVMMAQTLFGM